MVQTVFLDNLKHKGSMEISVISLEVIRFSGLNLLYGGRGGKPPQNCEATVIQSSFSLFPVCYTDETIDKDIL